MENITPFEMWLRFETGKKYLAVTGILAFIYSLYQICKGLDWIPKTINIDLPEKAIISLPYLIQIIFLTYVVFFAAFKYKSFKTPTKALDSEKQIWKDLRLHKTDSETPKNDIEKQKLWIKFKKGVNKTTRQFVNFWVLCWIVWLIFYLLITLNLYGVKIFQSITNLANNLNALFFIFLFMTLSVSTAKYGLWKWVKFGFIILIVFIINTIFEDNKAINLVLSLTSSLFAGLAMSAFIGSINSRTIAIPTWSLLLLNLYCAIQPLYIFFANENIIIKEYDFIIEWSKVIILLLAFFLKILLFLLVTWVLQTGRLLHFIIQEGSLNYLKEEQFNWLQLSVELKDTNLFEQSEI